MNRIDRLKRNTGLGAGLLLSPAWSIMVVQSKTDLVIDWHHWFLILFLLFSGCTSKTTAEWISPVPDKHQDYGVFLLRNNFTLKEMPDSLIIRVSADNRYKIWINNQFLGLGPARGDLQHWQFETYDIAPYLQEGKNTIAAEVVNFGKERPLAQITRQTAFWLNCNEKFSEIRTGSGNWRVLQNHAYQPISFGIFVAGQYYVCGPGDSINYQLYPAGWQSLQFDDSEWNGTHPVNTDSTSDYWQLKPRKIPLLERRSEDINKLVRVMGNTNQLQKQPKGTLLIAANSTISLLYDLEYLTMGFPEISFAGGKNSTVKITYAEALLDENGKKGNRNEIEGKKIAGYYDKLLPDGRDFIFSPFWLRTFRYIQLDIETSDEELKINHIKNFFTAYPLALDAGFKTDNQLYDEFWQVGWRTLRLCAGETYFDCPYYEQLQYVGDTRVQALISLYLSADERLVRQAIEQFSYTIRPDGLTLSRHPAHEEQIIPGFSLYWVSMLYDFLMIRGDSLFVKQYLPAVESLLQYFEPYIQENDMLGYLPHGDTVGGGLPQFWYFTDWSSGFYRGMPQGIYDNYSSIVSLHYAYTLDQAAQLFQYFEKEEKALALFNLANRIKAGTVKACLDKKRGLLAQTPDQQLFSQHANILAVLTDAFPEDQQKLILTKVLRDENLIQCSMYYRFYLFEALKKAGMTSEIPGLLDFWENALQMGLTTFPEKERNTRSDCHAWNASPLYEFLTAFAGVTPLEPGFKKVKIAPVFSTFSSFNTTIPTKRGNIQVSLNQSKRIEGEIILPMGMTGVLEYNNKNFTLSEGRNRINVE